MFKRLLSIILFATVLITAEAKVTVAVKMDSVQIMIGQQTGVTLTVQMPAKSRLELP